MPDIHIERSHDLGLPKARKVAAQWAEQVERNYGLRCTVTKGPGMDVTHFTRSGVNGTVKVTGKSFELDMKLGFLFGLFSQRISEGVTRALDELIEPSEAVAPKKPAVKKAPPKPIAPTPAKAAAARPGQGAGAPRTHAPAKDAKAPAAKSPAPRSPATKAPAAKPPAAKTAAAKTAATAKAAAKSHSPTRARPAGGK